LSLARDEKAGKRGKTGTERAWDVQREFKLWELSEDSGTTNCGSLRCATKLGVSGANMVVRGDD
jgi:hypothetical protein